jgi:hypothetical protein
MSRSSVPGDGRTEPPPPDCPQTRAGCVARVAHRPAVSRSCRICCDESGDILRIGRTPPVPRNRPFHRTRAGNHPDRQQPRRPPGRSGSADHALRLWDVATGREIRTFVVSAGFDGTSAPAGAFSDGQGPRGAAAPPGCRQTPDWRTGAQCPGPGRSAAIEKASPAQADENHGRRRSERQSGGQILIAPPRPRPSCWTASAAYPDSGWPRKAKQSLSA